VSEELIVVRQLPVIEERLQQVKADIEARVSNVLSLACTEDTYKVVKKARSDMNKEYAELERSRKMVKAAILAPYERFEALYRECAGNIYAQADAKLKARIVEVEDGLRQRKQDEVAVYFDEYRESLGLDEFYTLAMSGIKVTLSDSVKSLKSRAKGFLDRVAEDLALIETQAHKEEILVEYKRTLNISQAVTIVSDRHQRMEVERQRREQAEADRIARAEAQARVERIAAEEAPAVLPMAPPVAMPTPDVAEERICGVVFRVESTLDKLRALRTFLEEGGYTYYEQRDEQH